MLKEQKNALTPSSCDTDVNVTFAELIRSKDVLKKEVELMKLVLEGLVPEEQLTRFDFVFARHRHRRCNCGAETFEVNAQRVDMVSCAYVTSRRI